MMFAAQLASQIIPVVHPSDTVQVVLDLMQENHIMHLPVLEDDRFLGLIHEEDLLDSTEQDQPVSSFSQFYISITATEHTHLYHLLKMAQEHALTVIPVIKDNKEFLGSIPLSNLLHATADLLSVKDPGAVIVLETEPAHFSPGEIFRLTETNDAMVMQMNSSIDAYTGKMMISLKINKPDVSDIVATFQRYEYNVVFYQGEEQYENELRSNYENLINFLNI